MKDTDYITAARAQYQREGSIEIDDNAVVSRGSDPGAYVAAWVWVEDPKAQEGDYGSEDDPDRPLVCIDCGQEINDDECMARNNGEYSHLNACPPPVQSDCRNEESDAQR